VQIVANGPHHHLARVEADPDLHLEAMRAAHLRAVVPGGVLHGEGGIAGPHGVVFMRDRRPEQGHNPVAHDLVHGPLAAVHRGHHALQHRVEELARLLGVAVGQQLQRAFEISKEHRDLLALPFQSTLRGQDLLDQMTWRVTDRWLEVWRGWLPAEGRAAFATELRPWKIVSPAPGAAGPQGIATPDAELAAVEIVRLAVGAAHRDSP
jgi:hypothetical protein